MQYVQLILHVYCVLMNPVLLVGRDWISCCHV